MAAQNKILQLEQENNKYTIELTTNQNIFKE